MSVNDTQPFNFIPEPFGGKRWKWLPQKVYYGRAKLLSYTLNDTDDEVSYSVELIPVGKVHKKWTWFGVRIWPLWRKG